jgi:hypothetical protein
MTSALLDLKIPTRREARLAILRRHTAELPFFDRYDAGDREAAWAGLQELGPQVREDPYAADALAVAYETMARARANLETIAQRLGAMGYRFFSCARPVREPVLRAPARSAFSQILALEKEAGALPLSARAWFAISGNVELTGVHPRLSFIRDRSPERSQLEWDLVFTDPLVIYGVEDASKCFEYAGHVGFSGCASTKADADDGGDPYMLILEAAGADCLIHGCLGVSERITFVQYLRRACEWGGFPGFSEPKWAEYRPPELDNLREGLLPI